jgi:hypothetical protein
MLSKKLAVSACVGVLALGVACGKSAHSPVSPSAAADQAGGAGPDAVTLKVTAPTPVSPINNAQPAGGVVLVATRAQPKFASNMVLRYEFEVLDANSQVVYSSHEVAGVPAGGDRISQSVDGVLAYDAPHKWRVRAVYQGAAGPWSSLADFRSPAGGYIHGNEIFDPLTNGETVGTAHGPTQFIKGKGIKLISFESYVTYVLPQNLQEGEFSLMVTGIDEGSPGGKTKVMSRQEGPDVTNIITDDYRFTAEKLGRDYLSGPGAVTFRIITGESSNPDRVHDARRTVVKFSDEKWYFWKLIWGTGYAGLQVREGGPDGPIIFNQRRGTDSHPYRPNPHYVHLGSPVGRSGSRAASIPGMIVKNVWLSSRPRPNF